MKITWYGTASILLESEGERLLFDPFVELAGASNPNSLEDFVQERISASRMDMWIIFFSYRKSWNRPMPRFLPPGL